MPNQEYVNYLYMVADFYGIDRDIAYRQINQESEFKPGARSGAGAVGIAQFIPATGRKYGLRIDTVADERLDPFKSLDAWGKYMYALLDLFDYRYDLALAGYNSGENRSEYYNAYQFDRPINWSILPARVQTETRDYVLKILGTDQPFYGPVEAAASGGPVETPQGGPAQIPVYSDLPPPPPIYSVGTGSQFPVVPVAIGAGVLLFASLFAGR